MHIGNNSLGIGDGDRTICFRICGYAIQIILLRYPEMVNHPRLHKMWNLAVYCGT